MSTTLGIFSRPWSPWDLDASLQGAAQAGFQAFGTMRFQKQSVFDADTPADEVDATRQGIESAGLEPLIALGSLDTADRLRLMLEDTKRAGMKSVLVCGSSKEEEYDACYDRLREAAQAATELGLKVALKPHGGISATADDCLRVLDKVSHDGLEVWYDPGNIIFYTGQDPTEDVKKIAGRVSGVCIKDCVGGMKGKVMVTPGVGEVDFDAVLGTLYEAGFSGPLVVECVGGETLDEVNAEATKTVEFLRETLQRIGVS